MTPLLYAFSILSISFCVSPRICAFVSGMTMSDFANDRPARVAVQFFLVVALFFYGSLVWTGVISMTSSKLLPVYIGIFSNQQFNQDVKDLCMDYIGQLLKHYTDKRGKDYQDIKKFVSTVFVDLKFLMEKEVVEMLKTRRKRKPADV